MPSFPSFSAIVEWENARLSGTERAANMLAILLAQTAEVRDKLERPPELIILYDRTDVSLDDLHAAIAAAGATKASIDIRLHPVEEARYYQQKNIGAKLASREFVLFIDSDVLPEPGWLRALLGAARAGADVVAGDTYVDPTTFLGRAFSCLWFFPLRSTTGGIREAKHFFANNVMFRRTLFLKYPFPDLPLYRGQCAELARTLRREGVQIFIHGDARVCHPPPEPSEFAHRAMCEGHDRAKKAQLRGDPGKSGLPELRRQLDHMARAAESRAQVLGMSEEETRAAVALALDYARLRVAGARWTGRSPEKAAKFLGIATGRHAPFHCRNLVIPAIPEPLPQTALRISEPAVARLVAGKA